MIFLIKKKERKERKYIEYITASHKHCHAWLMPFQIGFHSLNHYMIPWQKKLVAFSARLSQSQVC